MNHIIQHFRKEEQPFIEQVVGWQREVEDRYAPKLTDFLDPRQRFIIQAIIGQSSDIKTFCEGIFDEAERQRVYIAPSYFVAEQQDFQITIFTIKYPTKFVQLKHPDVLGALISLGLDRSKYGDIRVDENVIQFAVATEVADYIRANLTSVGKVKVHAEEVSEQTPLIQLQEEWNEKNVTVSSMRLDVIIATVSNISRQKAQNLIAAGKVKVNWTEALRPDFVLDLLDIISVRGFGRIQIQGLEGTTKKEKVRLLLGVLRK